MENKDFQNVINDILNKINELKYDDKSKEILKYLIETMIQRFCVNEEVMNDTIRIVNEYTRKKVK